MWRSERKSVSKYDKYLVKYGNGSAHLNNDLLPKINGKHITGVWCPDRFSTDMAMLDDTNWSFTARFGIVDHKYTEIVNRDRCLPKEFKEVLGWQVINGKRVFVQNLSFREDRSGHASFDSFLSVYVGGDQDNVYYYDASVPYYSDKWYTQKDPYCQRVLDLCGRNFETIYKPNPNQEWEPRFPGLEGDQGTFFFKAGGLNWPCKFSRPWSRSGHLPFVSNKMKENGCPDRTHIRVLDEDKRTIYYFSKVLEEYEVGDESLYDLTFPRDWKESLYYVFVMRWVESACPFESFIDHRVLTKHRNGEYTIGYLLDGKIHHKRRGYPNFYRIVNITKF